MNNTRILFVVFFVFVFFSALLIRLVNIQIKNHEDLDYFAKRQQVEAKILRADRGFVFDRNGELLAYDRNDISFYVDKRMLNTARIEKIAVKFSEIFGKRKNYYVNRMKGDSIIICLQKKAPREKAIQLKDFVVDGLFQREDPTRIYSYDNIASHIMGYVSDTYKGIEGVEKYYNDELTGRDGKMLVERDVRGRMVTVADEATIKPEHGKSIYLTVDLSYQKVLQDELSKGLETFKGSSAVGIIMDPNNGEILASATLPDFDPNFYWKYSDENRRNRSLTDTYEPGSTFKSIAVSTLLDRQLCRSNEMINTENGIYRLKGRTIRDSHEHSALTVQEIIEQSSNIGMAKLITRIDEDSFYKYLRNFGFGNYSSIDLPGETRGKLKKPGSFEKYSLLSMSYGYEVSVTPIQLITAYSALINGGNLYQPHLLKRITKRNNELVEEVTPKFLRRVIEPATSNTVKKFLRGVVEYGTAKIAKSDKISVGGKTGTSKLLIDNRYSNKYNSSFIGFFPVENPKILCLIVVYAPQVGGYGGIVAAPIFKNVTDRLLSLDPSLLPSRSNGNINSFENVFTSIKVSQEKKYSDLPEQETSKTVVTYSKIFNKNVMPDLANNQLRQALSTLARLGLKYRVVGTGKVIDQSIKPGEKIKPGMVCFLNCEERKISRININ